MIANNAQTATLEESPVILNLAGLLEAAQLLVKEKGEQNAITSVVEKTIETAVKEVSASDNAAVAMVPEEGLARLAALDSERYGKTAVMQQAKEGYSATLELDADRLDEEKLRLAEICSKNLVGGCSISVKIQPNTRSEDLRELIKTLSRRLLFFRIGLDLSVCRSCGAKNAGTASRCAVCKSTALIRRTLT
jgi:anaerobic ribonucleoside-triphosphate reductase